VQWQLAEKQEQLTARECLHTFEYEKGSRMTYFLSLYLRLRIVCQHGKCGRTRKVCRLVQGSRRRTLFLPDAGAVSACSSGVGSVLECDPTSMSAWSRLFRINVRKNTICLPILLSPSFSVSHPEDWTGSAFRAPHCRIIFP
jgi:hypothetical protein